MWMQINYQAFVTKVFADIKNLMDTFMPVQKPTDFMYLQ